jgi:hypothetical protein
MPEQTEQVQMLSITLSMSQARLLAKYAKTKNIATEKILVDLRKATGAPW